MIKIIYHRKKQSDSPTQGKLKRVGWFLCDEKALGLRQEEIRTSHKGALWQFKFSFMSPSPQNNACGMWRYACEKPQAKETGEASYSLHT